MKFLILLVSLSACASPPMHYAPKPVPVSRNQVQYAMPSPTPRPASQGPKIEYRETTVNNFYYCKPVSK